METTLSLNIGFTIDHYTLGNAFYDAMDRTEWFTLSDLDTHDGASMADCLEMAEKVIGGKSVQVTDLDTYKVYTISLANIAQAMEYLSKEYPHIFANLLTDDIQEDEYIYLIEVMVFGNLVLNKE